MPKADALTGFCDVKSTSKNAAKIAVAVGTRTIILPNEISPSCSLESKIRDLSSEQAFTNHPSDQYKVAGKPETTCTVCLCSSKRRTG
jgi:hypothetical protein